MTVNNARTMVSAQSSVSLVSTQRTREGLVPISGVFAMRFHWLLASSSAMRSGMKRCSHG